MPIFLNLISGKSRQQQQRHITTTSPMGGGGGQIVQITFADLSGKEARTTNSQNHTGMNT